MADLRPVFEPEVVFDQNHKPYVFLQAPFSFLFISLEIPVSTFLRRFSLNVIRDLMPIIVL